MVSTVVSDIRAYLAQSSAIEFMKHYHVPMYCQAADIGIERFYEQNEDFLHEYGWAPTAHGIKLTLTPIKFHPKTKGRLTRDVFYYQAARPESVDIMDVLDGYRLVMAGASRSRLVLWFQYTPEDYETKDVTKAYTVKEQKEYERLEQEFQSFQHKVELCMDPIPNYPADEVKEDVMLDKSIEESMDALYAVHRKYWEW